MTLVTVPNVEILARDYLASVDDVTALVDVANICSELPAGWAATAAPALRVLRVGGSPDWHGPLQWVDRPRVQIEAWARTKNTAHDLASVAMAAAVAAPSAVHDLAVVKKVKVIVGPADIPDPTFKPATHRFVFDTVWTLHPHRDGT